MMSFQLSLSRWQTSNQALFCVLFVKCKETPWDYQMRKQLVVTDVDSCKDIEIESFNTNNEDFRNAN